MRRLFNNDQAWVTSVLHEPSEDDSVRKALTLAASLRRLCTTRALVVIASMKISSKSRDILREIFDFVFFLEEDRNSGRLKIQDFAKISAVGLLRPFGKCVYIAPGLLPVKNCDEIFENHLNLDLDKSFEFLEHGDKKSSLFIFKPSVKVFQTLNAGLQSNGSSFKQLVKVKGDAVGKEETDSFDYNYVTSLLNFDPEKLTKLSDISIVDCDELDLQLENHQKVSIIWNMARAYWKRLQDEEVEPLLMRHTVDDPGQGHPTSDYTKEPIAIVGMSCRFPGSNNLEEFWNLLAEGDDGISNPPPFRWLPEQTAFPLNSSSELRRTKAGFLKVPVDHYDPKFFGVTAKDAVFLDPQQRLLHEVIWESLEDAGIDPLALHGTSGSVFLGSWLSDYKDLLVFDSSFLPKVKGQHHEQEFWRTYMGTSLGTMTSRISHLLGMTGPSVATESGCSSAMVALHLAQRSLQLGETDMAIAGGVNLLLHPFDKDVMPMVVAPDGHSKTFCEKADGFARAEGCGILVLKRFADAVKNGDRIWALLRGSGVSQEGLSKSMGTPTVHCEALAMTKALEDCGGDVTPEMVSYVEAHGTGTVVGDPLEIAAIAKAYGGSKRVEPLIIGSVKTNVGHTESCSGITGVIKVVLSMFHETIPKHRNFHRLNPHIDLDCIPARLPLETVPWKRCSKKRLAGVSSFGITGTDAHVILEEAPFPAVKAHAFQETFQDFQERSLHILKISAKSEDALSELLEGFQEKLQNSPESESLEDICFTANTGRANFDHRCIILGSTKLAMADNIVKRKFLVDEKGGKDCGNICFLFTGQGSQYPEMARDLYETSPVFQLHFDHCSKILLDEFQINLRDALWSTSGSNLISKTIYSQTSIFCVEYALLKLWESLGVTPEFVLGHSLGEFCAAISAGILSLTEALKLVASRSLLIERKTLPGKMLVVKGHLAEVKLALEKFSSGNKLDIAAVNSNEQTVVAGDPEVILEFSKFLLEHEDFQLKNLVLDATHAFHSRHMDHILEAYQKVVEEVVTSSRSRSRSKHSNHTVFISSVLGTPISWDSKESINWIDYWVEHTRSEVRFMEASRKAVKDLECRVFLEIGPHPVLSALTLSNVLEEKCSKDIQCLPSLKRGEGSWSTLLQSLGKLWVKGHFDRIDWSALDDLRGRQKVRLPNYPFQRKKFWPEMASSKREGEPIHPLVGTPFPSAISNTKVFQSKINVNLEFLEYLRDHVVGSRVLLPGAAFLEMCLAAGIAYFLPGIPFLGTGSSRPMKVENLRILAPLELQQENFEGQHLQIIVDLNPDPDMKTNDHDGDATVKIFQEMKLETGSDSKKSTSTWLNHATATFSPMLASSPEKMKLDIGTRTGSESLSQAIQRIIGTDSGSDSGSSEDVLQQIYDKCASVGLKFGPAFRSLEKIWKPSKNELVAKVKLPSDDKNQDEVKGQDYLVHPVVLDAMIQSIMMLKLTSTMKRKLFVPISVGNFVWLGTSGSNSSSQRKSLYIYTFDDNDSNSTSSDIEDLRTLGVTAILFEMEEPESSLETTSNDPMKVIPICTMSSVEFIDTTAKALESLLEQQTNALPDLWEEVWHSKVGGVQHRLQVEQCNWEGSQLCSKNGMERFRVKNNGSQREFLELEQFCYWNVLRALTECGWRWDFQSFQENEMLQKLEILSKYRKMFRHYLEVLALEGHLEILEGQCEGYEGHIWRVTRTPDLEGISKKLENFKFSPKFSSLKLYEEVGKHLAEILRGQRSPLGILFPQQEESMDSSKTPVPSLHEFYGDYANFFGIEQAMVEILKEYLKMISEGSPGSKVILRILEIGAGTGAQTQTILRELQNFQVDFEYVFTDISPAFFPQAEKRFQEFGKVKMKYRKLNIEEDPMCQGFTPEYFDYILAQDVVHATKDISVTLDNIWQLLKPGGRFDLLEQTRVNRPVVFLAGLLDGFWRFEDSDLRKDHCTLSVERWLQVLGGGCGGHGGFEVKGSWQVLDDHHSCFSIKKVCKGQEVKGQSTKAWILYHITENQISEFLCNKLGSLNGRRIIPVTFDLDYKDINQMLSDISVEDLEGVIFCWSLINHRDPEVFQEKVLRSYFDLLRSLAKLPLRNYFRLICITGNCVAPNDDQFQGEISNIGASAVWGLTKSFRNEHVAVNCCSIDVDLIGTGSESLELEQQNILQEIFYQIWNTEKESQVALRISAGTVQKFIPKLAPLKPKTVLRDLELPVLGTGLQRFQLRLPESKSIHDVEFCYLERFSDDDEEDKVEVQIKVSALNFRDLMSVMKPTEQFENSYAVGLDFAGIVTKVGTSITKWKPGDRVFGLNAANAALPSHALVCEDELLAVPNSWTLPEAATLPAVACTAFYCLVEVSKVKPTDTVLIHTASGGVGLAAIQICRGLGVPPSNIICTAGSKRKRRYLRETLGIPHVFNSRCFQDYRSGIMEVTKGQGVTVVLNSITGEGFKEATLETCSKNQGHRCRFVEMSKLQIWEPEEVRKRRPDVDYYIVDLSTFDRSELRHHIGNIRECLEQGKISPIPYTRFDAVNIREALQFLQRARHIGKVVVVMPEVGTSRPGHGNGPEVVTPLFNAESTYLITGGLGGIGFTVCEWMVRKHGARNVILAGRSSPSSKVLETIYKLKEDIPGSKVIPYSLDVSNYDQLSDLVHSKIPGTWNLPTLRGIMHCAGTLQDGLIENQEWSTFSSTLPAKITGTLNLHEVSKNLPLEHFILFSSVTSLFGSPAQGNHTAGNCFQDAFTHFRISQGLPAQTINWGQWGQVGVATEIDLPGLRPLSNLQGLSALEFVLRSQRSQTAAVNIDSFVLLSKIFPHFQTYFFDSSKKGQGSLSGSLSTRLQTVSNDFWQKYDSLEKDDRDRKLELVSDLLKQVLRYSLQLDQDEDVPEEKSFQEMGVDSLMLVEIKNSLQSLMRDRVMISASVLRDCTNLKLLTIRLVQLIEGDTIEGQRSRPPLEEVSNLIREDSRLPENIRAKSGQLPVPIAEVKVVLVTGVTGTLGVHIWKELTSSTSTLTQVICLMRHQQHKNSNDTINGEQRLLKILQERRVDLERSKVNLRIVYGDVSLEHLGLEDSLWTELGNEVDAVFHCAAHVQHLEHYSKNSFDSKSREVNIQGLKNILEFCVTGSKLKRLCHFSSFIAATKIDQGENDHGPVRISESWPEVTDFDGVTTFMYPVTKFVGELLLKEAVLHRGIPAKIFRLPLIFGNPEISMRNHVLLRYMFCLKSGVISGNSFPLMLLPVDKCASASVRIFFDGRDLPDEIYNLCHPQPSVDQEFCGVAERLGFQVRVVEMEEFLEKVRSFQEDTSGSLSPFTLLKELYTQENEKDALSIVTTVPVANYWVKQELECPGSNFEFFKSGKIEKFAPDFYEKLEKSSMEYVYRDLEVAREVGYFKKFGL